MGDGFRLPSSRILRNRGDFGTIYHQGCKWVDHFFVFYVLARPGAAESRVGFIASRKLGGAVRRNRAKRLLRESFRLLQHQYPLEADMIFVARKRLVGARLQELMPEMEQTLARASKTIAEMEAE